MKHALRLLSRFIILSLLLFVTLTSLIVLYDYVIGFDRDRASWDTVAAFLAAMREAVAPAIIAACVVALFTTIRSVSRPFVPLVMLAIVWTAMLAAVAVLWPQPVQSPKAVPAVPEARIVRFPGAALFVQDVEGFQGKNAVVHRPGTSTGTELFPVVVFDPEVRRVVVPGRSEIELPLDVMSATYPAMVDPPARLEPLLRDLGTLNRILSDSSLGSRLLPALAIGLFLLACWTPARLTRWPLFNAVFVFFCIRGVLWLLNEVYFGELGRLSMSAVGASDPSLIAAGLITIVSAIFLVILFLMQPLSSWKRELGDE